MLAFFPARDMGLGNCVHVGLNGGTSTWRKAVVNNLLYLSDQPTEVPVPAICPFRPRYNRAFPGLSFRPFFICYLPLTFKYIVYLRVLK